MIIWNEKKKKLTLYPVNKKAGPKQKLSQCQSIILNRILTKVHTERIIDHKSIYRANLKCIMN